MSGFIAAVLLVVFFAFRHSARTPQEFATSTALQAISNVPQAIEWSAYHNTKYGFSFKYPSNFEIESDDQPASSPDEGSDITVSKPNLVHAQFPQWLEIVVHAQLTKDSFYQLPSTLLAGPVDNLVRSIWKLAKTEGTASGPVATTTVGDEVAYMFTVTDDVGVNGLGYAIGTENQWIFLRRDDLVFEISLPNTQEFISILNTFQFDKR